MLRHHNIISDRTWAEPVHDLDQPGQGHPGQQPYQPTILELSPDPSVPERRGRSMAGTRGTGRDIRRGSKETDIMQRVPKHQQVRFSFFILKPSSPFSVQFCPCQSHPLLVTAPDNTIPKQQQMSPYFHTLSDMVESEVISYQIKGTTGVLNMLMLQI